MSYIVKLECWVPKNMFNSPCHQITRCRCPCACFCCSGFISYLKSHLIILCNCYMYICLFIFSIVFFFFLICLFFLTSFFFLILIFFHFLLISSFFLFLFFYYFKFKDLLICVTEDIIICYSWFSQNSFFFKCAISRIELLEYIFNSFI